MSVPRKYNILWHGMLLNSVDVIQFTIALFDWETYNKVCIPFFEPSKNFSSLKKSKEAQKSSPLNSKESAASKLKLQKYISHLPITPS